MEMKVENKAKKVSSYLKNNLALMCIFRLFEGWWKGEGSDLALVGLGKGQSLGSE